MAVSQAQTLSDHALAALLDRLGHESRRPRVDRVVFLLSYKAGLRVQEIAGLRWAENVLDAHGQIRHEEFYTPGSRGRRKIELRPVLFIGSDIGKYGTARNVPIHPLLFKGLEALRKEALPGPWVVPSGKDGADQDIKARAHALKMRINRFYKEIGYENCSSHSGRRTFVTKTARQANLTGCSLVDVQKMAGHRQLTTTQAYIDVTTHQCDLVDLA